jgi:hypothetical protein
VNDDECKLATISELRPRLRELDGARGNLWALTRSHSALVLRFMMPGWTNRRTFMDCISCSSIFVVPQWEPVRVTIDRLNDQPGSPLLVVDRDHLRVECEKARLTTMDDSHREELFRGPSAVRSHFDLLDRIRESVTHQPHRSFAGLSAFLAGYETALSDNLLAWRLETPSIFQFEQWLKRRFGREDMPIDWRHVIKSEFKDDRTAYDEFFNLLATFRTESAEVAST